MHRAQRSKLPLLLLGCAALASLASCSLGRRFLYFPQPISPARLDHLRSGVTGVREIELEAGDGTGLHGWVVEKDFATLPTVLYFGGNAEEVSSNVEAFRARLRANAVLVNYRGYGASGGAPQEELLYSDAEEVYRFTGSKLGVPEERIVAMGRSLGSALAVRLAADHGIAKTILVTPFDSIESVAGDFFPKVLVRLFLRDRFKAIEAAPRLRGAVLVLTAGRDEAIGPEHAQRLFEAITAEKELAHLDAAGHNDVARHAAYWERLNRFLSR